MTDDKNLPKIPHNVIMENRKKLSVSGVTDIDSFDEQTLVINDQYFHWSVSSDL